MSLIIKFCEAIGTGVGTVVSHKVKNDLEYNKNMENKSFYKTKTIDKRIDELEMDSFLGDSYLGELIDKSYKLDHLQSIKGYLEIEDKSSNLPNEEYYSLLRKVNTKINEKQKEQDLKEILEYVRMQKRKGGVS